MADKFFEDQFEEIPVTPSPGRYTNRQMLTGKHIAPIDQIKTYTDTDWEQFINDWVNAVLKSKYVKVWKSKGSGDKGRDIVAFHSEPIQTSEWDTFQCKHYKDALAPSNVWLEIGKFIYFQFIGEFGKPKSYSFVAPCGVGNKLLLLLQNTNTLKTELIKVWNDKCKDHIVKTEVKLEGEFEKFVLEYDFSIFTFIEPQTLIEEFSETKGYSLRFGGGLQKVRPEPDLPPSNVQENEQTYLLQLRLAYSDHEKAEIGPEDLKKHENYNDHYRRQRENFYEAESLKRFADETLVDGGRYEDLEKEIHNGIADVLDGKHDSAFDKVVETLKTAKQVQISDHPLKGDLTTGDRGGICHQLVNKKKIKWLK